jgi:hypothetical protein
VEHLLIQSDGGPLGLVGRLHVDRPRPTLLVINGSWPPRGFLHDLVSHFRGASVLIANLPGMSGVFWSNQPNLADLTQGLEHAVRLLAPEAPIVAFGISTGNLLSLGLRAPNIRRRVAVEPFFQTKDLWPFIANSRERMLLNPSSEGMARFLWEYFGISADQAENRDYRHLLDNIDVPTDVMVGRLPLLPQREVEVWPSFTTEEDRANLAANPLVTLHVGP